MSATQKHTPTPWRAGSYSSIVGVPIMAQPDPKQNTIIVAGTRSAAATTPDGFRAEVEANAAFIVRAVNAHDDLVKALRELIESMPAEGQAVPRANTLWRGMMTRARAALSKAGE
jgi:hypothetical protein